MQTEWEKQGKPQHMKPHGKILRMLLLGGGGCGKSRIVNLIFTALLLQFWSPWLREGGAIKQSSQGNPRQNITRCGKARRRLAKHAQRALQSCSPERPRVPLGIMWSLGH